MTTEKVENIKDKATSKLRSNPLLTILLALIGSGMVGYYFTYVDNSNIREDSYVQRYVKEVKECNTEIRRLEKRITVLENGQNDIPFPYWIKDRYQNIIFINKAYNRTILAPLGYNENDILYTKGEILGLDFVKRITGNDIEVMNQNKILVFDETVPNVGDGTSFKYPIYTRNGGINGTGGIWIRENIKESYK